MTNIAPNASSLLWITPKSSAAGALPQTPTGVAYTYSASKLLWLGLNFFESLSCEVFISNSTEINTNIGWFWFFQIWFKMNWNFRFSNASQNLSENSDQYSTKCFLSTVNYTKIVSGWGSAPDPTGVAYTYCDLQCIQTVMAWIKLLWEFEMWSLHFKSYWN